MEASRRCRWRATRPKHLTSIIPMFFTDDRYTDDCHFRGGLMRKYYDVSMYGNMMCAWNALPAYPEWSEDWGRSGRSISPATSRTYSSGSAIRLTEYWRNGSVGHIADRIKCPAFLIGGWRDGYPNPPLRLYQALQVPKKVLIGPWDHRRAGRRGARARASTTSTRSCAGSTTGAAARTTASWPSRPSSCSCRRATRRSSTGSSRRAAGAPSRPGRSPA